MLYWNANFQIPNSGIQAAEVYAILGEDNYVNFYADKELMRFLFDKKYNFPTNIDPYDYLLSLEEFSNYTKM